MTRNLLSKLTLAGVLAIFTVLTVAPQPAEAGPVRVRFTPPFGAPFGANLDWGGVVDIDDGGCLATGTVSNLAGGCAGRFSFTSGTLTLTDLTNPLVTESIPLNTFSSTILSVERSTLAPEDFQGAAATPFAAVQSSIPLAIYDPPGESAPRSAWFSLVLLGGTDIRLYWFDKQPDSFGLSPFLYQQCGRGSVVEVGDFGFCGISDAARFPAEVTVTAVPEPSTYAMMLAGLGILGFAARRRAARV